MARTNLCPNDEFQLIEALKNCRDMLEHVGIEGVATVTFEADGTIEAVLAVDDNTTMHVKITDDDNTKSVSYL